MKERNEMTYEERLEAAERHRLKGNALFTEVRFIFATHLTFVKEIYFQASCIVNRYTWQVKVHEHNVYNPEPEDHNAEPNILRVGHSE